MLEINPILIFILKKAPQNHVNISLSVFWSKVFYLMSSDLFQRGVLHVIRSGLCARQSITPSVVSSHKNSHSFPTKGKHHSSSLAN